MTAAQKKAKDNFKKAIAYRKKCGCSLKEAFAHVYGKKVGAVKKKAAPKKKVAKKAAKKKIAKKAAPKKKAPVRNYGSHKDTASHNVKISVVSGIVKAKPSIIILSKKIEKLTEINDHNKAVLELAKFLKEKKAISSINSIMKMHDNFGHMTSELIGIRRQILSNLLKKLKNKYGEVDYKIIDNSY